VDLYSHSPYTFMSQCLVKQGDNFTVVMRSGHPKRALVHILEMMGRIWQIGLLLVVGNAADLQRTILCKKHKNELLPCKHCIAIWVPHCLETPDYRKWGNGDDESRLLTSWTLKKTIFWNVTPCGSC
jgi:hypothetical protein